MFTIIFIRSNVYITYNNNTYRNTTKRKKKTGEMLNNFGNVVEMKEFIVLHIIFVLSKFINLRLIYRLKLNFLDWNCLIFQKLIKIFTFF